MLGRMLLSAAKPRYVRNGYVCALGLDIGEAACGRAGSLARAGVALAALMLAGQSAAAQASKSDQPKAAVQSSSGRVQALRAKLNQETLVIAAGRPGTSYMAMAGDLAAAVAASGGVRLLPLTTDGGGANLQDLLFLRGVDLAIVPANVLASARTTHALGAALAHRIAYVTALYSEGVHVIAGHGIAAIGDLGGRKVAVPAGDDTVAFTAGDILKRLGINVETVPMEPADALEEVREGKIAAVVLVGCKPLVQVSALPKDGSLRLLSLPFQALSGEGYVPAVFVAEDYPALIPPGAIVETVAVGAVLMASKGGEETRRIARHTPVLLTAIGTLASSGRHSSWRDVNLGTVLPGWFRVEAAERWLSQAFAQRKQQLKEGSEPPRALKPVKSTAVSPPQERKQLKEGSEPPRVLKPVKSTAVSPPQERKKLFDEFDAWASQSAAAQSDLE